MLSVCKPHFIKNLTNFFMVLCKGYRTHGISVKRLEFHNPQEYIMMMLQIYSIELIYNIPYYKFREQYTYWHLLCPTYGHTWFITLFKHTNKQLKLFHDLKRSFGREIIFTQSLTFNRAAPFWSDRYAPCSLTWKVLRKRRAGVIDSCLLDHRERGQVPLSYT